MVLGAATAAPENWRLGWPAILQLLTDLGRLPGAAGSMTTSELLKLAQKHRLASRLTLTHMPQQILLKILHLVATDEGRGNTRTERGPALLFELCLVCRKFDRLLCEDSQFWRIAWDAYLRRANEPDIRGAAGTAREKLRLLAYQGCMMCHGPRARKVYWPFRVRCCAECFGRYAAETKHLRRKPFRIPAHALNGEASFTEQKYNPRYEEWGFTSPYYTVQWYWKPLLEAGGRLLPKYATADTFAELDPKYVQPIRVPWRDRDLILKGSFSDDDPVDSSEDEDAAPARTMAGGAIPSSSEAMMARDMAAIMHLPPEVQQAAANAIIRLHMPEAAAIAAGAADAVAAGGAVPAAADAATVPAHLLGNGRPSQSSQQQPEAARSSQQHQHAALAPSSQPIEDVAPATVLPAAAVKAVPQDAAPVPLPPLPPLRCMPHQTQPVAQPLPPDLYAPSLLGTPRAAWLLPPPLPLQQAQHNQQQQLPQQGLPSGQQWPPPLQQQLLQWPQQGQQQSLHDSQLWAQPSAQLPIFPHQSMQQLQQLQPHFLLTPFPPGSLPQQPQSSAWQGATRMADYVSLPATQRSSAASSQCDFPQMGLGPLSQPSGPAAWEQHADAALAAPAWQLQPQALAAPGGTKGSSAALTIAGASPSPGKRSLAMATGGPSTTSMPAAATVGAPDPAEVGATYVPLPEEPTMAAAAAAATAAMLAAVKTEPPDGEGAAKAAPVNSVDAADLAAGSSRPKRRRTKTARLLE